MHSTLSISLNLHRSTSAFRSGFFSVSRCNDFNAAQQLSVQRAALEQPDAERLATFQDDLIACSSAVAARMIAVETQCCLRRRQREAKTSEPEKCQCNAVRICCSKDEWKILEGKSGHQ